MKTWFYQIKGKSKGPIGQEELLFAIRYGELTGATLVRQKESDSWIEVSKVDGLLPKKKSKKEKEREAKRRKKLRKINNKIFFKLMYMIFMVVLFFVLVLYR